MGKMSKEVPRPLFSMRKVSHAFILVMDIFPSLCSPFRMLLYFCLSLVIFFLLFSWILVITGELYLLLVVCHYHVLSHHCLVCLYIVCVHLSFSIQVDVLVADGSPVLISSVFTAFLLRSNRRLMIHLHSIPPLLLIPYSSTSSDLELKIIDRRTP